MARIYKSYMQQVDSALSPIPGTKRELESDFEGLYYLKCSGLESRGEIKNIYTESYADADTLRVYHPSDSGHRATREATEVDLSLLFLGEERRKSVDRFIKYISENRIYYWDNIRHKKVLLLSRDEIKVEEDYLGSKPYIKLSIRFDNLWGEGKACNEDGSLAND